MTRDFQWVAYGTNYITSNWGVSANGLCKPKLHHFLRKKDTNQWIFMLCGMKMIYKLPCHIRPRRKRQFKWEILQGWTQIWVQVSGSFSLKSAIFSLGKSWENQWAPF